MDRVMIRIAIALSMLGSSASAFSESDVKTCLCFGRSEVNLPSGARVDCIQDGFAIEVDPTGRWAEALGQSLHYAAVTNLRPKIVLYCIEDFGVCLAHQLGLQETIKRFSLPIVLELHDEESLRQVCPDTWAK